MKKKMENLKRKSEPDVFVVKKIINLDLFFFNVFEASIVAILCTYPNVF